MDSIQCMNNNLSIYNNNNTNETCYCYMNSQKDFDEMTLKHFIKICDLCLILLVIVAIGIQYFQIIRTPRHI